VASLEANAQPHQKRIPGRQRHLQVQARNHSCADGKSYRLPIEVLGPEGINWARCQEAVTIPWPQAHSILIRMEVI